MQQMVAPQLDVEGFATDMLVHVGRSRAFDARIRDMIARWQAFCALPDDVKSRFGYHQDPTFSGYGYEDKRAGNGFDRKEDFHFRMDRIEDLYQEAENTGADEAHALLVSLEDTRHDLDDLMGQVARAVGERYKLLHLAKEVWVRGPMRIIRLLHYLPGGKAGAILGEQHCDKAGFTATLYEDRPGVERMTRGGDWVPMDVIPGHSFVFPGLLLQLRSEGKLIAPCHRIVANEATARHGRWSAVAFSDLAHPMVYDKETYGRTQSHPPRWNYGMPHEEFSRFFKARTL